MMQRPQVMADSLLLDGTVKCSVAMLRCELALSPQSQSSLLQWLRQDDALAVL